MADVMAGTWNGLEEVLVARFDEEEEETAWDADREEEWEEEDDEWDEDDDEWDEDDDEWDEDDDAEDGDDWEEGEDEV